MKEINVVLESINKLIANINTIQKQNASSKNEV